MMLVMKLVGENGNCIGKCQMNSFVLSCSNAGVKATQTNRSSVTPGECSREAKSGSIQQSITCLNLKDLTLYLSAFFPCHYSNLNNFPAAKTAGDSFFFFPFCFVVMKIFKHI